MLQPATAINPRVCSLRRISSLQYRWSEHWQCTYSPKESVRRDLLKVQVSLTLCVGWFGIHVTLPSRVSGYRYGFLEGEYSAAILWLRGLSCVKSKICVHHWGCCFVEPPQGLYETEHSEKSSHVAPGYYSPCKMCHAHTTSALRWVMQKR